MTDDPSDERVKYHEWVSHVEGCPYVGIDDDTVPCECPVIGSTYHEPPCEDTECRFCWPKPRGGVRWFA